MAVLLLNASYEPLNVIPLRRAISLMLRERVDAATDDTLTVRSASDAFEIPIVLRLKRYVNVPQRGARWSRRAVFQRDQYTCIYCGITIGDKRGGSKLTLRSFSLDHIVPKSRGGRNSWVNTACACNRCNQRKGSRMPHEAGMRLLWEPKTPRVNYLVAAGEIPQAWKIYLEV